MNHRLAPDVDTIFLMTAAQYFYVSSSLVKEVAQFGGDVDWMVPPGIPASLRERLGVVKTPQPKDVP
jgi:pantetheine-phosphate adenylyltransferase